MDVDTDRAIGCLLGLALGDALGAPYEGGILERLLWRAIGTTGSGAARWTDDTQMALDLAETLIANRHVQQEDLARRFASSYHWSRGYGPGTARLLRRIRAGEPWQDAVRSVYPSGSYGNGAAMRAPVVGISYATHPEMLSEAARASAEVTHAHPLGIEGAVLMATATARLATQAPVQRVLEAVFERSREDVFRSRLEVARVWLESHRPVKPGEIRRELGNDSTAVGSVVTALYLGLRFLDDPFHLLMEVVVRCRGDADTIGAMAGALWGAANGAGRLPTEALEKLEERDRIEETSRALCETDPDG